MRIWLDFCSRVIELVPIDKKFNEFQESICNKANDGEKWHDYID